MIYMSSIAFMGQSMEEMTKVAQTHEWPLEFSSGIPFHPQALDFFYNYPLPHLAHNYFPAPKEPFVLNLASNDGAIRQRSVDHCLRGLAISRHVNAPFYCAHAGFCLDPNPAELGKKLDQPTEKIDRQLHWNVFLDSIRIILAKAEEVSVDFYIENNVTAAMNLNLHGQNPLLCSHFEEIKQLFTDLNHPRFGLLLDTAHLKVSAQTLSFDLKTALSQLSPHIKALHHSDNNGQLDSNQPLTTDYWFKEFMPTFGNLPNVIEVKQIKTTQINQQISLLRSFAQRSNDA